LPGLRQSEAFRVPNLVAAAVILIAWHVTSRARLFLPAMEVFGSAAG
jgi:hypothetical protein